MPAGKSIVNALPIQDSLWLTFYFNFPSCPGACDGAVYVEVQGGQPPYSFAWSNDSIGSSLMNVCPGMVSVTVTDALGNTAMNSVYIPNISPPTLYISNLIITQPTGGQNNGSIALDTSFVDTSGYFANLVWSLDSIHFTPYHIFRNLGPGTYHLYTTEPMFGCIIRVENEIILYESTSVEPLELPFDLWPNPVTANLHVHAAVFLTLKLIDMNGKEIISASSARQHDLSVSHIPDGLYILILSDGQNYAFHKVLKCSRS